MSVVSLRPILPHEEILVSYNYRLWMAPEWYQEQWVKYKREIEQVSEVSKENFLLTLKYYQYLVK